MKQETQKNMNLAREFVHRLENTCYNPTTIQVINAMAQNTNFENQLFYGGLLSLRRQTHLGRSTLNRHIRLLRSDGLIQAVYSKNELFNEGKRQNYRLILPPPHLTHCGEWEIHNQGTNHLDSFQSFLDRLATYRDEERRLAEIQDSKKPPLWVVELLDDSSDEDDYF